MAMIKAVLLLSLSAACIGDDAYAPPSGGYDTPTGGYDTPTGGYDAPTGGYDSGYDQGGYDQGGYDDSGSYDVADCRTFGTCPPGDDLDIGAKISELIPLFIAVFAAIILAQLLVPLLLGLLGMFSGLLVGILPMAIGIKAPIINLILNPFGLSLCAIGDPVLGIAMPGATQANPLVFPAAAGGGRSFTSRELHDAVGVFGFDISEDRLDIISDFVFNSFSALSSE
jgi:hypothetical protein